MVEAMRSNRKKKTKSDLAEREYVESNKPVFRQAMPGDISVCIDLFSL